MKTAVFVMLLFMANACLGQQKLNLALKKQLDSISATDRRYRELLTQLMDPNKGRSVANNLGLTIQQATSKYWRSQNRIDSMNLVSVALILQKYGYPGRSLVGEPTNEAAWYVIQHSPKIKQYIPYVKTAAYNKELPFWLYAKMLDRQLMDEGKEQLYGTQAVMRPLRNGKNIGWYIWPIKNAADVNARRKKAGFDNTVEENARNLDITYTVIKIDQVQ